jgi:choline dehydrogenase-like flavoprotein
LPRADNHVAFGPGGRIKLTYTPSNLEAHERLLAKFRSLLDAMRCEQDIIHRNTYLGGRLGISGVAHQNGTARFGTDATTSVLDIDCRMHDVDNLYVVDSSFFVSSSAVNPTLTIIANALRVADHLAHRLS